MVSCFRPILPERLGREETYDVFADISATSPKISRLSAYNGFAVKAMTKRDLCP